MDLQLFTHQKKGGGESKSIFHMLFKKKKLGKRTSQVHIYYCARAGTEGLAEGPAADLRWVS